MKQKLSEKFIENQFMFFINWTGNWKKSNHKNYNTDNKVHDRFQFYVFPSKPFSFFFLNESLGQVFAGLNSIDM